MISIKMFCNMKKETSFFKERTKCEILIIQQNIVKIKAKSKNGKKIIGIVPLCDLENFRYFAWYNGNKIEFKSAKKLAKIATFLYNAIGQDLYLVGNFDIQQIKKLTDQVLPVVEYYEKKCKK